jgi:type II secretory pathway predicted ATPase ExeA
VSDHPTFTARVLNPIASEADLLTRILQEFGVVSSDHLKAGELARVTTQELFDTLHAFLRSLIPLHANAVLMIDEPQHLPAPVLEQIRLLSNLTSGAQPLLQILVPGGTGQPVAVHMPASVEQRVHSNWKRQRAPLFTAAAVVLLGSVLAVATAAYVYESVATGDEYDHRGSTTVSRRAPGS